MPRGERRAGRRCPPGGTLQPGDQPPPRPPHDRPDLLPEEKGLTGHFSGNNAFIKFTAEEANGKRTYSQEPSEIYAICNGAVYTLIATPTETSAVTVRLAAAKAETVAENLSATGNLPLEKQALQLLREALATKSAATALVMPITAALVVP